MIKRTIRDIKKYGFYAVEAAKSDLKAEVAGSYLNWLWWIINPLCFMLLYAFVFGYVFDAREQYFPIFIFIGISIWDFFRNSMTQSVKCLKKNKMVISRVYMPKYILLMELMCVNAFKMFISFCLVVVMMVFFAVPVSMNVFYFIPVMITLFLVTFGFACFFMHLGVFVTDMNNVVTLGLRLTMYLTGVFYNIETKIPKYGKMIATYNPVAFLISSLRKCLIYESAPDLTALAIWFVVGLVLSSLGILTIYKEENGYVKVI